MWLESCKYNSFVKDFFFFLQFLNFSSSNSDFIFYYRFKIRLFLQLPSSFLVFLSFYLEIGTLYLEIQNLNDQFTYHSSVITLLVSSEFLLVLINLIFYYSFFFVSHNSFYVSFSDSFFSQLRIYTLYFWDAFYLHLWVYFLKLALYVLKFYLESLHLEFLY